MNADLERLVRLQKLDTEIARKSAILKSLPEEINRHGATLEEAKSRLTVFDTSVDEDKKKRRELEREVETAKDSIAKSKGKLPNLKTNVEYRAALKEVETFEQKIKELEDAQLELMMKMEDLGALRKPLEERVKAEEVKFNVVKTEKEAAMAELSRIIDKVKSERDGVVGGISATVLSDYERVQKARDGLGVALVTERLCQGCNQMVPPQLYYQLRTTDDIYKCPHCSRFIYHEAEESEKAVQ
ncbi:MAG: hypothetical protein HZB29_10970 [Nitrospinae bacterium]|nr:hypothetical protein [Nitrospinota bacterium]